MGTCIYWYIKKNRNHIYQNINGISRFANQNDFICLFLKLVFLHFFFINSMHYLCSKRIIKAKTTQIKRDPRTLASLVATDPTSWTTSLCDDPPLPFPFFLAFTAGPGSASSWLLPLPFSPAFIGEPQGSQLLPAFGTALGESSQKQTWKRARPVGHQRFF